MGKLKEGVIKSIKTDVSGLRADHTVLVVDWQQVYNDGLKEFRAKKKLTWDDGELYMHLYTECLTKIIEDNIGKYSEIVLVNSTRVDAALLELNEFQFDTVSYDELLPIYKLEDKYRHMENIILPPHYEEFQFEELRQIAFHSIISRFVPGVITLDKADLTPQQKADICETIISKNKCDIAKKLKYVDKPNADDPEEIRNFPLNRFTPYYMRYFVYNIFNGVVTKLHVKDRCKLITSCIEDDFTMAHYIIQDSAIHPDYLYYARSSDSDILCNLATARNCILLWRGLEINPIDWWHQFLGTTLTQQSINLLWGLLGSDYTEKALSLSEISPLWFRPQEDCSKYAQFIKRYLRCSSITDEAIHEFVRKLLSNQRGKPYYKPLVLGFEVANSIKRVGFLTVNPLPEFRSLSELRNFIRANELWRFSFNSDVPFFDRPDE